ncbi:MAG: phage tail protein [Dehalococcoidales bacterium]
MFVVIEAQPSSNYTEKVMGEHKLTVSFDLPVQIDLMVGDYVTFEGVRYTLNKLPGIKKISSHLFQYSAVFEHPKYDLLKAIYMFFDNTPAPPQGEFSLTGTAEVFIDLLIANANRTGTGWVKGDVEETEYRTLTFNNENCLNVLDRLAAEFETEYHVRNKTIHFGKQSSARELTLEYGSTVYDIERVSVNSADVVTRLYPFGSDKNIASSYRDGSKRLMIPDPDTYLDSTNTAVYGIVEQSKVFEDVYPRLQLTGAGVVTAVGDKFTFSDNKIDFDVNNYLLPNVPAKIQFLTGDCAGYSFEIESYKHSGKFVIIENKEDKDFSLPTELLKPAVDDKYVLLDVEMPPAYVQAAEEELLDKAETYLADNDTAKVDYRVRFSEIYARTHELTIQCGDDVHVLDEDLGVDENIRIVSLQKDLRGGFNINIELSNTVTRTLLQRIDSELGRIDTGIITLDEARRRAGIVSERRTRELKEMVFDPDGYFDAENIRPLSIEAGMISVGAKSQQYQLTCLLQPNYNANAQSLHWSAGVLMHFTLVENEVKEWTIAAGNTTITGENQTEALYIYVRCSKSGSTGDIHLSTVAKKFDSDDIHWLFLIGVLHSPVNGVRGISLTYGQTTISGGVIRTGRISSGDGNTTFDLDAGEIRGNISFLSKGNYKSINDVSLFLQKQLDADVPVYQREDSPSDDWHSDDEKQHNVGAIWYDDTQGRMFRYSSTFSWVEIHNPKLDDATQRINESEYLQAALRGTTDVHGGLLATNLLRMKNEQGNITAGMSGLSDNIGFWAGGDYADALNDNAKIILRKDGSGHMAANQLRWTDDGKLSLGKIFASKSIIIEPDANIPSLEDIEGKESYVIEQYYHEDAVNINDPAHKPISELFLDYTKEFELIYDAKVSMDVELRVGYGSGLTGFGTDGFIGIEKFNGTSWVDMGYGHDYSTEGNVNYYTYPLDYPDPNNELDILPQGRYRLVLGMQFGYTSQQSSDASIAVYYSADMGIQYLVKKLVIASDGISFTDSMSDNYFRLSLQDSIPLRYRGNTLMASPDGKTKIELINDGIKIGGQTDIPGVLAAGSVAATSGGQTNVWGAKKSLSNAGVSSGTYTIPHNIGHSNYAVQITPRAASRTAYVSTKNNTSVVVVITNLSGTGIDTDFDYVIVGDNN